MATRVLLIGAYGQFGSRIAAELACDPIELVLAGRSSERALALADDLRPGSAATLSATTLDVTDASLRETIASLEPNLVIHTAGPFQARDYAVAEAALAAGAHYVDLADGREFVGGIGALDARARAAGRWAISGASSVPGLSAAVVEAHRSRFSRLLAVESAISPGNRTERGLATTSAILGYVGKPIPMRLHGSWRVGHGWQSLRRLSLQGIGTRWVARCDVPDLSVLPARYPSLESCEFRAGLELRRMQFGLWTASWLVRTGILHSLQPWARQLLRISELWLAAGSDTGIMVVDMRGEGIDRRPLHLRWQIVARDGSGPRIPAAAAVVLTRKLVRGTLPGAGAKPCLDLFTLDELLASMDAYPIEAALEAIPVR